MGYAAHVVADVTIHPVIELCVSDSTLNAMAHRRCELHQDAYIFRRMNPDEVARSAHFGNGIWTCGDRPGSGALDQTISTAWHRILSDCHPGEYMENAPAIDAWHAGFKWAVDAAVVGTRMPRLARTLAVYRTRQ
jgi:hypothetical protein